MRKCNLSILWLVFSLFVVSDCLSAVKSFPYPSEQAVLDPYTSSNEELVSVKMILEEKTIAPSRPFWVCFQFHIAPEWHLYWKNPGDSGAPPQITWKLPKGFKVGKELWPFPERYVIDPFVVYGHEKELFLLVPIYPPATLKDQGRVEGLVEQRVEERVELHAEVQWLGCSTTCVPGNAFFTFQVPVSTTIPQPYRGAADFFKHVRMWLPIESKQAIGHIENKTLEIEVQPVVPLRKIVSVLFFPENAKVMNAHTIPTFQVNQSGKLYVHVPLEDTELPIQGVLVVKDDGYDGVKKHAWKIVVGDSAPQDVQAYLSDASTNNSSELVALENKVWYRSLLDSDLAKIILFAFLGGMVLNIMPCVLPIVSLKMLHFVELRGLDRQTFVKHGLCYSSGVILCFWLLAASIYLLQLFGKIVGWGFQLQNPYFVALLAIILFILALGMFGLFEFGISLSSTAAEIQQSAQTKNPSFFTSFLSGVLATFVASPCTGPLLGSAIGFAATQDPATSFLIFTSLGVGMAFPFLVLTVVPGISKIIPRPGRWMVTFKELMGFFLMATVLWLIWVLVGQTKDLSLISMLSALFIISVGVWIWGTWGSLNRAKPTRIVAKIVALIFVVWGATTLLSDISRTRVGGKAQTPQVQNWESFSQQKLQVYLQQRRPVFVDVTAKWCLTCQANSVVLESNKVQEAFKRYGVVKMMADWTNGDPEITAFLRSHGRNGVPFYVIFPVGGDKPPIILPEVITPEIVVDALNKAFAS